MGKGWAGINGKYLTPFKREQVGKKVLPAYLDYIMHQRKKNPPVTLAQNFSSFPKTFDRCRREGRGRKGFFFGGGRGGRAIEGSSKGVFWGILPSALIFFLYPREILADICDGDRK